MRGRSRGAGKGTSTREVTWVVCLVLYLVALAHYFKLIHVGELGNWAWILGFGLLLIAGKVRGL
jgi:hypothetical protein